MGKYGASLAVGILVGVIYGLLGERSPAPPVVALIGLLGILIGEQIIPIAGRLIAGRPISVAWLERDCVPHVFGALPSRPATSVEQETDDARNLPSSD
jgi:XapX domain-containing protein